MIRVWNRKIGDAYKRGWMKKIFLTFAGSEEDIDYRKRCSIRSDIFEMRKAGTAVFTSAVNMGTSKWWGFYSSRVWLIVRREIRKATRVWCIVWKYQEQSSSNRVSYSWQVKNNSLRILRLESQKLESKTVLLNSSRLVLETQSQSYGNIKIKMPQSHFISILLMNYNHLHTPHELQPSPYSWTTIF